MRTIYSNILIDSLIHSSFITVSRFWLVFCYVEEQSERIFENPNWTPDTGEKQQGKFSSAPG